MDCFEIKALRERLGELKEEMLEMKSSVDTEERSFSDNEISIGQLQTKIQLSDDLDVTSSRYPLDIWGIKLDGFIY